MIKFIYLQEIIDLVLLGWTGRHLAFFHAIVVGRSAPVFYTACDLKPSILPSSPPIQSITRFYMTLPQSSPHVCKIKGMIGRRTENSLSVFPDPFPSSLVSYNNCRIQGTMEFKKKKIENYFCHKWQVGRYFN